MAALAVPRSEWKKRAKEVLIRAGLSGKKNAFPAQLSGGEVQRVAIARALVTGPSLLLADEPTGNLDSKTGTEILSLFDELHKKGVTIIMVTHDPNIARHANRQIIVKDGRIVS